MALLFFSNDDDPAAWREALGARLGEIDLRVWPDLGDPAEITSALVWLPPPGLLASLPNLKAVFSLAAGVDAMLRDVTLPDVPLCRMVDTSLTEGMTEYVLTTVLLYHRHLDVFAAQQRRADWRLIVPLAAAERSVGVMGLGILGEAAARALADHGFKVSSWSRTPKNLQGVTCFHADSGLEAFLGGLDILVCLLPLTATTEHILNARLFAALPRGARLINVARGRHLVDQDLVDALATGQIAHATMDVFANEPLPPDHPFWRHPSITVTPHAASYSAPDSGAEIVAENIRRLAAGAPLLHVVDRHRGY